MFPLGPKDIAEGESYQVSQAWSPLKPLTFDQPSKKFREAVQDLYRLTGFPEPFLTGSEDFYRRWRDEHLSLLATEEVRDLSKIWDLTRLQNLALLLPEKVGSILSLNNLAQSLSCAHSTVSTWLDALEQVYMIFRISPYIGRLSRAIRKEKKAYFWDWGVLEDRGKRFENFLAVQLMRTVSAWTELGWGSFSLSYVRTKDGRETDFLIIKDRKPFILVEAKWSETSPDHSLLYFKERLSTPLAFQVVWEKDFIRQMNPGLFVIDLYRFLNLLI
jgi:predicted AAA+ superfamily ATPase